MRYQSLLIQRPLKQRERNWLSQLFQKNFPGCDILKEQCEQAYVIAETRAPYLALRLATRAKTPYPYKKRVPCSYYANQPVGCPIDVLLHVVNGFIIELELYNAGGDELRYSDHIALNDLVHWDMFEQNTHHSS